MEKRVKWLNRLSLPLQAIACMILYFVIEAISRHSIYEAFTYMHERPLVFFYNAGLIFTTTLIVYLFRRRAFARTLLGVFWLTLGIINGVILATRVTPFTGPDLHLITDAFKLANRYLPIVGLILAVLAFLAAVAVLIFIFLRAPKYQGKLNYKMNVPFILAGVLLFAGCTNLALDKRVLSNYFGNIAFAYEDYGYPYCLLTTIFNTGISCPPDYSEESMEAILKDSEKAGKTDTSRLPNILFLQLETFFDPGEVVFLEMSEDPIPYYHELMEKYSSGYYRVPSVGAGTANTEFESITGMSLHYFGPGEYPYKSILKETTCESAPYVLKELGYATHAIHNNEANFYGRKTIFPNLGFDTYTSEEYMEREDEQTPLGWVKDEILTDEILKAMESTEEQDYIYTISVQGHGDYPEEPVLEEPEITVTGAATEEENNKWEYYVNQLHEMDQFVKELTEALSKCGEDVVLVMYGDHLPTMGLEVEDVKNRYLFQTEYVIWDNMGLKKKDMNLASYQIAAEVMDRLDIHEGTVFRYHQTRKNTRNYQVDLEMLQYDILYGEQYVYNGENPYQRTEMRMGIYDATLDFITRSSDLEDSYYLRGSNFTPSSEVQINGEWYETTYVDNTTLLISGYTFNGKDLILVAQRSNSSTRKALSKTPEYRASKLWRKRKK